MKAVILAGGFGTRLRPLTIDVPKPMIPVANQPMMEHVVRLCERHGFVDLLTMLHYSPGVIKNYFENGKKWNVAMTYLRPEVDLGTAGCVRFAADHSDDKLLTQEPFLVISSDILTEINLTDAWNYHLEKKAAVTVVLTRSHKPRDFGVVITDLNGRVSRFLEKPTWGEVFSDTVNTGIYILSPEVVPLIPPGEAFDFSKSLFPRLLEKNIPIYGYVAEGYWKDIGNLTEYRMAHIDILEKKVDVKIMGSRLAGRPNVKVGDDTIIEPGVKFIGNVLVGRGCHIADNVEINQSVIGNNVRIESGASLRRSVVWGRTFLGPDTALREATIGRSVRVGRNTRVEVGAVVANRCEIGSEAVLKPAVKMWPEKSLEDGAVLSTSLVWGERWNKALFGSEGIMGLTNIEITPEFAAKVGAAYGAMLGQGAYVVTSRDTHKASRLIKRAIISGLLSSGVRVGDLRMLPTPVVRYEMGKEREHGGVHVRISPSNARQIEIRFFERDGRDLSLSREKAIEQLFMREDFHRAAVADVGELSVPSRAQEYYLSGFLNHIHSPTLKSRRFKVVVDYSHSAASMIFPEILGALGVESIALNANMSPTRVTRSEAELTQALEELSHIVTTLRVDAGFLIDNGAEKLYLVDEEGRIVTSEQSLNLVGLLVVQEGKNEIIAYPVKGSSVLEQFAARRGATILRTPMNLRHILEYARRPHVGFLGDGEGGFAFPRFQPSFDAMYAIAKILEMCAAQKTTLAKVARQIPQNLSVLHRRVPCPWGLKGQVMRMAHMHSGGQKVESIDGVKIHFVDGWALIRPDVNEAYCHVWVEAKTKSDAMKYLDDYSHQIEGWQEVKKEAKTSKRGKRDSVKSESMS